jgi:hypothetical protein
VRILTLESAIALAKLRVDELAIIAHDRFEILPESSKETEQGWVFFFNSADFVRTRNPTTALAGNGPILVTRDGAIYELPSAIPWEDAVKRINYNT